MSFDTHSIRSDKSLLAGSTASLLAPCLLLALLLGGLVACGKKGDPLPPLRNIPAPTGDLDLRQQGRLILLEMTYPSVTVNGLPVGGIDAVELYELVKPDVSEPVPVDGREFEGAAEELLTLRGTELGAALVGDRIQIRLPLGEIPDEPAQHTFGVRTAKGEEVSAFSNLVSLIPMEPPPAPEDLVATAEEDAIVLGWRSGDEVEGFDVFRRGAVERGYGEPIGRIDGDARTFRDRKVRYGERYIYTVRAVAKREPLIWSAEAGEREIDYEDRFAPPLPKNFVALGERNRVRLRWEDSAAADVAGYHLYRREPGRDFHRLTDDLVTSTEYIDRGLASGLSYGYRIQVVDRSGNESELSEPVSATVR